MVNQTSDSLRSMVKLMVVDRSDVIFSDSLELEKINLYCKFIGQMRPDEIMQAYSKTPAEPVWRAALAMYGPARIRTLM